METPNEVWQPSYYAPRRRGQFLTGVALGAAVASVVFLVFSTGIGNTVQDIVQSADEPAVQQPSSVSLAPAAAESTRTTGDAVSDSRRSAVVRAVERVAPAVVTVSVTQLQRARMRSPLLDQNPMWRYFFPDLGREIVREVQSMGSGVIVSADGVVITNEHVVRNASRIIVNLPDGRSFDATLRGADVQADVAVLNIDGENLPVAQIGRNDDLMIGEWAIAIGNPYGFLIRDVHPTVTVGVISALNRDFDASQSGDRVYRDMIQTDASINPGNSGGPLVNSEGYVIGINTFIFSQSGGSVGLGFAIPIVKAAQVMDDILQYGEVRHNFWTGIHIQDINEWIAESLGLPSANGVIVTDVEAESPAARAGLRRGDVIVAVNGRQISRISDVRREFRGSMVGESMTLAIIREGERSELTIVLEEDPMSRRKRG